MMCKNQGLDFSRIRNLMRDNYKRNVNLPMAGFASGPCLLKDTMFIKRHYATIAILQTQIPIMS